ncbi:ATP-dependent Clp protease proteolytic subunit (plasmid) [Moellerella wisconsensis]|uniref:ATP-dependent Clp protease proteolytic subunit n=1 Tax=Moellerella wisconsensis TaxID=158849 RepID=UPI001F4D5893|nr:ATP-dependent Clp protease proteolytic subunit [Moellerella wisconsensis]UNH29205.1 ATP-dependent Clp protease proteolytic subunit [Moellerella wisconsensis]
MLRGLFLSLSVFLSSNTLAAVIVPYVNQTSEVNIQITGPIEARDDIKLAAILNEIEDKGLNVEYVVVNSPGGDVTAAKNMAFAINSKKTNTVIVENGTCASACFLMFVAGDKRFIFKNAIVGVHQISFAGQSNLTTKGLSLDMSDLYDFFRVPENISYRMLKTPPQDLYQLSDIDKQHFDNVSQIDNRKFSITNPQLLEKDIENIQTIDIYNLALSYYLGYGTNKDLKKAYDYFHLASNKGFAPALHKLGVMYHKGIYVKKDEKKGDKYWEAASNLGYMPSKINLVIADLDSNPTAALSALNEAIKSSKSDKGLVGFSYYTLGDYYLDKGFKKEALEYFLNGAKFGNPYAQYMVGYLMMLEADQQKRKNGYFWIESSCYGGNIEACQYIGK